MGNFVIVGLFTERVQKTDQWWVQKYSNGEDAKEKVINEKYGGGAFCHVVRMLLHSAPYK